jgi:hypothetical protein
MPTLVGESPTVRNEYMTAAPLHVVTGAFGYSGRYITAELLARGARVRTLTNSLHRDNPFGDKIEVHPINFNGMCPVKWWKLGVGLSGTLPERICA